MLSECGSRLTKDCVTRTARRQEHSSSEGMNVVLRRTQERKEELTRAWHGYIVCPSLSSLVAWTGEGHNNMPMPMTMTMTSIGEVTCTLVSA